jgi:DNA mismatch endonuclease (patch repair protein)
MRANRSRDTAPELALRSELHRRGLRFRVDTEPVKGLRRRADIVFGPARVAVLVHGCFWHGCPEHYVAPKTNREFWAQKAIINRRRDADTLVQWKAEGWVVMVIWEHEDLVAAAIDIERTVRSLRAELGT